MPLLHRKIFASRFFALALIVLPAVALALALGARFYSVFTEPVTVDTALGAGTAEAPYSDALGPWLDGSMSYYLRDVPHNYLYRPTIGLFFSTIISVTNSIAAVPVVWILLFFAMCGALFWLGGWSYRATLTGILGLLVVFFPELILPLNPGTLMADFWPMAIGLAGIWLIALSAGRESFNMAGAAAGFFLLGITACLRGPQLASGAALLVLFAPGWYKRRAWLAFLLLPAIFAAPFVIDSKIQKNHGIDSNGIVTLYSIYTDPNHQWTPQTHALYLREKPEPKEVGRRYLKLLFSAEGADIVCDRCASVLEQIVNLAASGSFIAALAALTVLGWFAGRVATTRSERQPFGPWARKAVFALPIAAGVGTVFTAGESQLLIFACFVGTLALAAWATGRQLTAALAVAFCGALAFHAAIGLTGGGRVIGSYEIFLVAAIAAAVTERPGDAPASPAPLRWVAGALLLLVLTGYTGNFWLRRGFKAHLREQLAVPQTAVKISDSPRLDRSLYLTGQIGIFYTRLDPTPFGQVRRYTKMNAPKGWGNVTFLEPAVVNWAPSDQSSRSP